VIRFPNGFEFTYVVASGALGFYGEGWPWERPLIWLKLIDPNLFLVVAKTITLEPRRGNISAIRLIKGGTVNALGLPNPGIDKWIEDFPCRRLKSREQKPELLLSLAGNMYEIRTMVGRTQNFPLVGFELNFSCPTFDKNEPDEIVEICSAVRNMLGTTKGLVAKIGSNQIDLVPKISPFIDAVTLNSVPWSLAFPNKESPLARLGGGGVSGRAAQKVNWKAAQQIIYENKASIIVPDIWQYNDIHEVFMRGADAISFGAIHMLRPWAATRYVRRRRDN
jgi:dihydroorotate dehydrogenase (NAD+) catalytic subunit